MHSATWHESPQSIEFTDRVYLDVHIQESNDPSSKNIVCGVRDSEWINLLTEDEIFSNSRRQRLDALYKQLSNYKGANE